MLNRRRLITLSAASTHYEPNLISFMPSQLPRLGFVNPRFAARRIVCHVRGKFVAVPRQGFQECGKRELRRNCGVRRRARCVSSLFASPLCQRKRPAKPLNFGCLLKSQP